MDTNDRLQNETYACAQNIRYGVSGYYQLARMVLAHFFRREVAGLQGIQNSVNYVQCNGGWEWENSTQGVQMSRRQTSNADLIKAIDEGWRYFWKKRGYSEPPSIDSDTFIFGHEKNRNKTNKQKEAERAKGIQKAGREFLKGQGL